MVRNGGIYREALSRFATNYERRTLVDPFTHPSSVRFPKFYHDEIAGFEDGLVSSVGLLATLGLLPSLGFEI